MKITSRHLARIGLTHDAAENWSITLKIELELKDKTP
jgi:hypothetical protein